MKKVVIILGIAALIASGCGRTTKNSTKTGLAFVSKEKLSDNENFGNKQNPLYGKIYEYSRNLMDYIPELRSSDDFHLASAIQASDRFGIDAFMDDKGNMVCIFIEYIKEGNKILDTIRIENLREREYLILTCTQDDTIWDSEIFATFFLEDSKNFYDQPYLDKVVRAWRADTKTGRIKPIENLKGIIGINPDYAD